MAWIAHQLPRDPLALFHANIFYPEPWSLAFSEHLIVQGVMGLPLAAAGASPLLVHNIVLLAGFAFTAWSMWFVVSRWTGDSVAGLLAGALAAFNAHSFSRLTHVQAIHVEFLPLAILLLDRLLVAPRWWIGLLLGMCIALQGLTSYYWLVFTALAVGAVLLSRPGEWLGRRGKDLLWPGMLALAICALLLAPFLLPYYRVSTGLGIVRPLDEVAQYSGSWRDYLISSGRLHFSAWSHLLWDEGGKTPLFPGAVATALAVVGIAWGLRTDRRVRMWVAVAAVAFVFSFGVNVPGYVRLYDWLTPLQGIRSPVRAGHLVLIAMAALAGFGLAGVRRRLSGRAAPLVAVVAFVLVSAEAWVAPVPFTPGRQPSLAAKRLEGEPAGAVVSLPFPSPARVFANAQFMVDSTVHWRPMLNGYSGLIPPSYERHWWALREFPSAVSLQYLRDVGVTHVFVHHDGTPPPVPTGELESLGTRDGVSVFRIVDPPARSDLEPETPGAKP